MFARSIVLLFTAMLAMTLAFNPLRVMPTVRNSRTSLSMKLNEDVKKVLSAAVLSASIFAPMVAHAEIDYDGIKYLGGGDKIDLNNANIRAYLKLPGVYPTIASKIVTHGPFKTVADVYNIEELSSAEKDTLKKFESRFIVLDGKPEYVVDKINNGLYR